MYAENGFVGHGDGAMLRVGGRNGEVRLVLTVVALSTIARGERVGRVVEPGARSVATPATRELAVPVALNERVGKRGELPDTKEITRNATELIGVFRVGCGTRWRCTEEFI